MCKRRMKEGRCKLPPCGTKRVEKQSHFSPHINVLLFIRKGRIRLAVDGKMETIDRFHHNALRLHVKALFIYILCGSTDATFLTAIIHFLWSPFRSVKQSLHNTTHKTKVRMLFQRGRKEPQRRR